MLRTGLNPLRDHKFKYNFADTSDPLCIVCGSVEDPNHYLLHCSSFRLSRSTLMRRVSAIVNIDISTLPQRKIVSILLYGKDDITCRENFLILNEVAMYFTKSKRLDTF